MASVIAEGSVFAARYRIVRSIALGGMGAVYEAVHVETERPCALKTLLPELVEREGARERFLHEARVAARLRDDHVVDVFDAGVDAETGIPFLVMELLRGEDLATRLARMGRFTRAEVARYLHQAALGLDCAHAAGVIHRDLKPENLFVAERGDGPGRLKLLDFGIAMRTEDKDSRATPVAAGTPAYMAPEQFRPSTSTTSATDVYALAMIAYALLVGAEYWAEERDVAIDVYAFADICMGGPIEPPTARARRLGVALPEAFDPWFARATARDPAQRFQRATEAVAALADVLDVAFGVARPEPHSSLRGADAPRTPVPRLAVASRKSKTSIAIGALVAVVVLVYAAHELAARARPPRADATVRPAASATPPSRSSSDAELLVPPPIAIEPRVTPAAEPDADAPMTKQPNVARPPRQTAAPLPLPRPSPATMGRRRAPTGAAPGEEDGLYSRD